MNFRRSFQATSNSTFVLIIRIFTMGAMINIHDEDAGCPRSSTKADQTLLTKTHGSAALD